MKTQILFFIICSFFFFGCQQNGAVQEEILQLKTELAETQSQLKEKETAVKTEKLLMHLVYFKLKANATTEDKLAFTNMLKALVAIQEIKAFEVGQFKDLGDKRAMSEHDIVMEMAFENEVDYRTYQDHPIHLATKAKIKKYLGGPPVTYDYVVK